MFAGTCLEVFIYIKVKRHVFQVLENKKNVFEAVLQVYKMKKTFLERFSSLQNAKTRF